MLPTVVSREGRGLLQLPHRLDRVGADQGGVRPGERLLERRGEDHLRQLSHLLEACLLLLGDLDLLGLLPHLGHQPVGGRAHQGDVVGLPGEPVEVLVALESPPARPALAGGAAVQREDEVDEQRLCGPWCRVVIHEWSSTSRDPARARAGTRLRRQGRHRHRAAPDIEGVGGRPVVSGTGRHIRTGRHRDGTSASDGTTPCPSSDRHGETRSDQQPGEQGDNEEPRPDGLNRQGMCSTRPSRIEATANMPSGNTIDHRAGV